MNGGIVSYRSIFPASVFASWNLKGSGEKVWQLLELFTEILRKMEEKYQIPLNYIINVFVNKLFIVKKINYSCILQYIIEKYKLFQVFYSLFNNTKFYTLKDIIDEVYDS